MANIKSQIKRNRTNEKRRLRNKAAKSEIKTRIKVALRAAETGDEAAGEYLRQAAKKLDKAAARGIIHANQAANRKSALMHRAALVQASLEARSDEAEAEVAIGDRAATEAPPPATGSRPARAERAVLRPRLPRRGRRAKGQSGAGEESEAVSAGTVGHDEAVSAGTAGHDEAVSAGAVGHDEAVSAETAGHDEAVSAGTAGHDEAGETGEAAPAEDEAAAPEA